MPIRKTTVGWWWGSRGPYTTKSQAQSVARAAYSSGYRGDNDNNNHNDNNDHKHNHTKQSTNKSYRGK